MQSNLLKIPVYILVLLTCGTFYSCSKSGGPSTPAPQPSAPTITSLSVTTGVFTTAVTITGTGFDANPDNDQVFFNGKAAPIAFGSTTKLFVTVPLAAGTGNVTVSVNNGSVAKGPVFTYQPTEVVTTFAGALTGELGSADGTGTNARFFQPVGIAIDKDGNLYIADTGNNKIRKITPGGVVTTVAGTGAQGKTNGAAAQATFNAPQGLAVDANGNVYVADTFNSIIRKITSQGVVTTLAGGGNVSTLTNGTGTAASFYDPFGIAIDNNNNLYVTDLQNNMIRKITADGVVSTFAGSGDIGHADGTSTAATFGQPSGIAFDKAGNLYVSEVYNNLIRKITPQAVVTRYAGTNPGFVNGALNVAAFAQPTSITIDNNGNIYVSDSGNTLIRLISNNTVSTFAGNTDGAAAQDGPATKVGFINNLGIVAASNGDIYLIDHNQIKKITYL
jgi:sugar lactone lactonase YvrE